MRFRLRTMLIAVTVICAMFATLAWLVLEVTKDYYIVERFDLSNDRELIIWGATFWEVMPAFCYEIRAEDQTVVRKSYFANGGDKGEVPKFEVVVSSDGDVVGCIRAEDPEDFLCLYDFATGESWPGGEQWYALSPTDAATKVLEKEVVERLSRKLRSIDTHGTAP